MGQHIANLENLLLNELDNPNNVHLYLEGDQWCAYERSAYYLAEKISFIKIQKEVIGDGYDVILLKATFPVEKMNLPLSPGVALRSVADEQLLFSVDKRTEGFMEWKRKQLEKLSA